MSCHEVQTNLSAYLYEELDFAQEHELEEHLSSCALCRQALAREKTWHGALKAQQEDVPLALLAEFRQELKSVIAAERTERAAGGSARASLSEMWRHWSEPFGFSRSPWSVRLATASLLVFFGFAAGRYIDRHGLPAAFPLEGTSEASLLGASTSRIRDIQPAQNNQVRIIIDQVRQREITGSPDDDQVRRLLLTAMEDQADPGIRVDSVELLKGQAGDDVRDALLRTLRSDQNAAVRLKALESLRLFSSEKPIRDALKFVLEHDENPGVRSEAIDVLAPFDQTLSLTPELASTIQEVFRSQSSDDYVRMRCRQILQQLNAPVDIY
jgi:hypothetical protein